MATKTLKFIDVKSGWYISYFFMTEAGYGYNVKIYDEDTQEIYAQWTKPDDGDSEIDKYDGKSFKYMGTDGRLVCTVDCPESSHLDNSWSEGSIQPSSGTPILGRTYCAAFEDFGGSIDYNDFFVCLVAWSHEG
ncbi:hypothetical protein ACNFJN_15655 [Xenorhabdus budapestensis]|uniref:Uncharacterized protein n=1 Tax=Xenorhabdus budapestensis TaxID=290110 RepID=A0ABX7VEJ6_XENBU|nr:hypothetical protein [Xenorhabdus budapestensis]QTL39103.1 hypothetical protein HGO23_14765 [Xenorhabdus budapestensis]